MRVCLYVRVRALTDEQLKVTDFTMTVEIVGQSFPTSSWSTSRCPLVIPMGLVWSMMVFVTGIIMAMTMMARMTMMLIAMVAKATTMRMMALGTAQISNECLIFPNQLAIAGILYHFQW